ncbi:thioredoxin domain-containing protein [Lacinutrix sp. MedPE-SW]|uniref:thioredoxin domain-containing protein n=1 Tax=Lacinutrix sp. MedPE-SW TaxID=1860087 RepID=UPI0009218614|nr:thioredoxin domain-containing protein [Lacinutrix sp. MedPE-SW]OIQ16641.1 MAG: thioredoxin domain-containing protein [Lacinutrix sp. MedPE-SW]
MIHKYTNDLINETSPYLLQHAHNPVNWKAWHNSALELAKKENKLIIISVGYAACHWCHVMEHESFENEDVAIVMNSNFINIKIDREERPDIDQVYMNAVQLMTGSGGWPMNVVALPDGRPVWGGTYFKKEQWVNALNQISELYKKNPDKLYEYATKLAKGIKAMDLVKPNTNEPKFDTTFLKEIIADWSTYFDTHKGGIGKEPKFMMPNNYQFLLRYGYQKQDKEILDFVNTTLTKMAYGGIYDQIGGGFSRYSVDDKWHIPHFEKMLYDNAQLVSLYAEAFALTKNELYKNVVIETLEFIKRELTGTNGIFYTSLDADSLTEDNVLEEGAYYVWKKEELQTLLKDDFKLFSTYYNVNNYGYWEHKNYVLIRDKSDLKFTNQENITLEKLKEKKKRWKSILLKEREKRNLPRLDDKTLTSWNALMLKGYVDAYRVLQDENYLNCAIKNAEFILNNQLKEDGSLYHNYKNGTSSINGFLEDYATTIDAFIALYQVTATTKWLNNAKALTDYCFDTFFDTKSQLFFFTSNQDKKLIVQTIEYRDNVIPASNSIMANCLFKLSHFYNNTHYLKTSKNMLNNIKPEIHQYGSAFSNWMNLMLNFTEPFYEVAITGDKANEKVKDLNKEYLPNKIVACTESKNSLPLLNNRYVENKTLIYVCVNNTCKLPVTNTNQAINQLKIK